MVRRLEIIFTMKNMVKVSVVFSLVNRTLKLVHKAELGPLKVI